MASLISLWLVSLWLELGGGHSLLASESPSSVISAVVVVAVWLPGCVELEPPPTAALDEPILVDMSLVCIWLLMILATRALLLFRRRISWKSGVVTVEKVSPWVLVRIPLWLPLLWVLWLLLVSCDGLITKNGDGLLAPLEWLPDSSSSLISMGRLSIRRSMGRMPLDKFDVLLPVEPETIEGKSWLKWLDKYWLIFSNEVNWNL